MSEETTRTAGTIAKTAPPEDPFRFGWRFVKQPGPDGQETVLQVPLKYEDLLHPEEEDFIVQNDYHRLNCNYLDNALQMVFNGRDDVKVFYDHRINWQVEDLRPHGPDFAVFFEMRAPWDGYQGTFNVLDCGAKPVLVIEVTSPTTRSNDLIDKVDHYFRAGIPCYLIVDSRPELSTHRVHLLGYRHTPAGYVRMPLDHQGRLWVEAVGLWFQGEAEKVVCYDADNIRIPEVRELNRANRDLAARNEDLEQQTEEAILARRQLEADKAEEARRRERAEADKAEEARRREKAEADKADETRRREKAEADKAEEARLRTAIEARLAEMEAELSRLRGQS